MTNKNRQILEMVRNSNGHLTAQQAFDLAKEKGVVVSFASIYRILNKLADEGYIRKICVANKPDIFDKTLQQHEHLICKKCGAVTDINVDGLNELLVKQTGMEVNAYDLCIDYICDKCKKEN